MQHAGVPAQMIDESMPEALRNFDEYLAEGNSRAAAELQFKKDIDQASSLGKFMKSEEKQADAERTIRLVLLKMGLPQDEIELQLPAATRFFMVQLARGHSAAHALKLFRAQREAIKLAERNGLQKELGGGRSVELEECLQTCKELQEDYDSYDQNPDLSGALFVLSLLDKLDEKAARARAAAPARQQNPESKTSGWRRASVEDYGRAMREALEELAESDRAEVERCQDLYFQALQKENDELRRVLIPGHERIAEREARLH